MIAMADGGTPILILAIFAPSNLRSRNRPDIPSRMPRTREANRDNASFPFACENSSRANDGAKQDASKSGISENQTCSEDTRDVARPNHP